MTATGLELVSLGEMDFTLDDQPIDFSQTVTYKGFRLLHDVPNLASSFGYINASWTLRADLTCEYVCRLLNHMTTSGTTAVRITPPTRRCHHDPATVDRRLLGAGYMQRAMPMLPKQGDREPWLNTQDYAKDKVLFRRGEVDDGVMVFR
ncbi:MAG: hypothetical protein R2706_08865 [Acidimicrobiales bacterium]